MSSDKKRCFFIGPIGDPGKPERLHSDMVLNSIIKEALPDFVVHRADELHSGDMITKEIIGAIFDYDMAIADLTFHNPNVFYELALRHMKEMPIVHIAATGTRIPFDTAGHKAIFFDIADYNSHVKARADIKEAVEVRLAKGYKVSNPVTQARAELKLAESSDPKDVLIANLSKRLEAVEQEQFRQAEARNKPKLLASKYLKADIIAMAEKYEKSRQVSPGVVVRDVDKTKKQGGNPDDEVPF